MRTATQSLLSPPPSITRCASSDLDSLVRAVQMLQRAFRDRTMQVGHAGLNCASNDHPGNGHTASETSKEVVRRWFEAMERHALDEAVACWAPDAVNHASGRYGSQLPRGSEALLSLIHI